MTPKPLKPKKCKAGCGVVFAPRNSMQCVCSPACGLTLARAKREQDEAKRAREARQKDRQARERMKPRGQVLREAQAAFNAFIRKRDAGQPCICCDAVLVAGEVGGGFDAGHYRSVGSAPNLRFNEDNCHAQSKKCNRYGGGRAVDYRRGLIKRIGLERVEALEADQTPRHYSRDDLEAIKRTYRAKARELEKA